MVTTRSQTRFNNNINAHLPHELIIEVLIRLPVESVGRCKTVCKMWNSIVQDKYFIEMHLSRSVHKAHYLDANGYESLNVKQEQMFKRVYSRRGLLLERRDLFPKYRIRNPTTRQALYLPNPHGQVLYITLGFVEATREYKLVSSYHDKGKSCRGWEAFTLGRDSSWRPLGITSLAKYEKKMWFRACDKVVYGLRLGDNSEIDCLDLETERFTVVKVPKGLFSDWRGVKPRVWNDKFSLASTDGEEINLWVLENYKQQKWADEKIVIPWKSSKDEIPSFAAGGHTCTFFMGSDMTIDYDLKSKRFVEFNYARKGKKLQFFIQRTLVTFEGMHLIQRTNLERFEEQ